MTFTFEKWAERIYGKLIKGPKKEDTTWSITHEKHLNKNNIIFKNENIKNLCKTLKEENDKLKHYCEECPEETDGFYLCDDCEEEQFNKDEEMNNNE